MSGMFSLFCGPRKLSEDDEDNSNKIEYLESDSLTFDTLDTNGTDESSCSIHQRVDSANCESPLGTLIGDTQETMVLEKQNDIVYEQMAREGGELRDSVPTVHETDGVSNDPGLSPDLSVPDIAEGPDMPKDGSKPRLGRLNPVGDAKQDVRISDESTIMVVYQAMTDDPAEGFKAISKVLLTSPSGQESAAPADDTKSDCSSAAAAAMPNSDKVMLMKEGNTLHSSSSSCEEGFLDSKSEDGWYASNPGVEDDRTLERDIGSQNEGFADASEASQKTDSTDGCKHLEKQVTVTDLVSCPSLPISENTTVSLSSVESSKPEEFGTPTLVDDNFPRQGPEIAHLDLTENDTDVNRGIEKIASPEATPEAGAGALETKSDAKKTIASELFMLVLDHGEEAEEQDAVNVSPSAGSDSGDESKSIDRLKSNATEETCLESFDESHEKSVRFTDPLVTSSWDVPRIHSDDLEELFYTAMDISQFRQQRQKGAAPSRPYDKAHCERLVDDLDRFGAESFVAGDYQKALGAFNHSLQVKTQIMTDCDNYSTAITIHCIADCYSKKGKWIQAMDAYNAALLLLEKAVDTEEVRTSRIALDQKVHIIRRLLGLNGKPSL